MPSIGEIKAKNIEKNDKDESSERNKLFFFGVFFDGTGNNMIQPDRAKKLREKLRESNEKELATYKVSLELSDNGGNSIEEIASNESDFSNVAILHSSYFAMSDKERVEMSNDSDVYCYNIYVEGAGTSEVHTDSVLENTGNVVGSAAGLGNTGVPSLVEKAMILVQTRVSGFNITNNDEIHFDVFGFSRGATCARMFSHMVGAKHIILKCEKNFSSLVYKRNDMQNIVFLKQFTDANHNVDFLGIFDTVSSIGLSNNSDVIEYGLYSPNEDWVKTTFHIAALDEFRDHFRLTDIGLSCKNGSLEMFIPGCHSDVGGGYKSGIETITIKYYDKNEIMSVGGLLGRSRRIYVSNPQSKNGIVEDVTQAVLESMGWYSKEIADYEIKDNKLDNSFDITRTIRQGYSNIPLHMMALRSEKKTNRNCFTISEARFKNTSNDLDNILNKHKKGMKDLACNSDGRIFYVPKPELYKELRENVLHYSSSDRLISGSISGSSFVSSPTVHDGIITRIVYHGDNNDDSAKEHYINEYESK